MACVVYLFDLHSQQHFQNKRFNKQKSKRSKCRPDLRRRHGGWRRHPDSIPDLDGGGGGDISAASRIGRRRQRCSPPEAKQSHDQAHHVLGRQHIGSGQGRMVPLSHLVLLKDCPAWDWKPEQKVREESEEVANSLKFLNWLNDCYSVLLWHFTSHFLKLPKICSQPCPAHRPIMSLSWNPSLCCKTCDSIK